MANEIGFGYDPQECAQHFLVVIPRKKDSSVSVYERFAWDDGEQKTGLPGDENMKQKIVLSRDKWNIVKPTLEDYLNKMLKFTGRKTGRFILGETPVERLLGKEIMVLLWAIEDCDVSVIPDAIRNWQGLTREEKWWLFTMTNATTGDADYKRGWRIALRYAITDNPVMDSKEQRGLFDSLRREVI